MFFHFQVFLYSLVYFILFELISTESIGGILGGVFSSHLWLGILIIVVVAAYFYKIAKNISQRNCMTAIPVVFVLSSMGLLYFMETSLQQQFLIVLSTFVYYFIHLSLYRLRMYHKDKTALGIIAAGSVATIFIFYSASFGIYLNFDISLWFFMVMLLLATTLISFQYFWIIKTDKKMVLNYSLMLGLVMAEIIWVVNFWPFGYLTTGAITLIFYYVFWDLVQGHFLQNLSKRRVVANMVFFGFMVALVLASSKWLPIV